MTMQTRYLRTFGQEPSRLSPVTERLHTKERLKKLAFADLPALSAAGVRLDPPATPADTLQVKHARYSLLGRSLFVSWINTLDSQERERFGTHGVRHGFEVIFRILSHASDAWKSFHPTPEGRQDIAAFADTLQASIWTPNYFANMNAGNNATFERMYGLHDRTEAAAFIFADIPVGSKSAVRFIPNPDLHPALYGAQINEIKNSNEYICAAIGPMVTKLWRESVAVCATHPDLFPLELGVDPT